MDTRSTHIFLILFLDHFCCHQKTCKCPRKPNVPVDHVARLADTTAQTNLPSCSIEQMMDQFGNESKFQRVPVEFSFRHFGNSAVERVEAIPPMSFQPSTIRKLDRTPRGIIEHPHPRKVAISNTTAPNRSWLVQAIRDGETAKSEKPSDSA